MPNLDHYKGAKHKRWRATVLRRAKYLCEDCLRYGKKVDATTAHHIKPREQFPELALKVNNGVALCEACHNKRHPEKGGRHHDTNM